MDASIFDKIKLALCLSIWNQFWELSLEARCITFLRYMSIESSTKAPLHSYKYHDAPSSYLWQSHYCDWSDLCDNYTLTELEIWSNSLYFPVGRKVCRISFIIPTFSSAGLPQVLHQQGTVSLLEDEPVNYKGTNGYPSWWPFRIKFS